jgi:hypothetical protein
MISVAFQTISTPAPTDAGNIYELQPRRQLQTSFQPGRPGFINILSDDLAGNITFRLGSCNPDQAYTFKVCYQKAPSFFTENVKANVPIPDKLMHIFRYGFLAMAYLYNNDPKFAEMNQKFVATLLGAQSGLDVAQRNIFLGNWYSMLTDMGVLGGVANQGIQARGSM